MFKMIKEKFIPIIKTRKTIVNFNFRLMSGGQEDLLDNFTFQLNALRENKLPKFSLFNNFFRDFKQIIDQDLTKKLLLLDYLASYYVTNHLKFDEEEKSRMITLVTDTISGVNSESLKTLDSIYVLSLIESLSNLNFYPGMKYTSNECNKLWILLEYFVLRTPFIKNVSNENFYILLKSFQKFFVIPNSTVSAEEVFEAVEYQFIMNVKQTLNKVGNINTNLFSYNFSNFDQLQHLLHLFLLFAKNLEGSRELYKIFLENILTKENFKLISEVKPKLLLEIYTSLILLNLYEKNKQVKNLITILDLMINDLLQRRIIKPNSVDLSLLQWSQLKIKENRKL